MKTYLYAFVNWKQNNGIRLLPVAELLIITLRTPIQITYYLSLIVSITLEFPLKMSVMHTLDLF